MTNDLSQKRFASNVPADEGIVVDSDTDEDSVEEFDFIESQWQDGVETGLILRWPGTAREVKISTKLSEDAIAPLFDGTQWAGTRVWKAAVVALEYMIREFRNDSVATPSSVASNSPSSIPLFSLLELGCGLGVPGMLWHLLQEEQIQKRNQSSPSSSSSSALEVPPKLSSPRVVLTDMPDLLPQLKANVQSNFAETYGSSIEAKALDWSTEGLQQLWRDEKEQQQQQQQQQKLQVQEDHQHHQSKVFDICLNCDCIYEPLYGREAWESLADVLVEIARVSPKTILITSVERRPGDGLENFIERVEVNHTDIIQPMKRVLRNEEDPHHIIEIYVTQGIVRE